VIASNAVSGTSYKRREQSNSIRLDIGSTFAEWSDITNTAIGQFFMMAEEIVSSSVPTATRIEQAKSARLIIEELAKLNENWDGYGAASISQQTRDNALRFINLIEAAPYGVPAPEICPKPNGTISFEWETPRTEAYLEIGNTRFSGFITTDQLPPAFFEGHADSMDLQIVALVRRAVSLAPTHPASITEIYTPTPKHEHLAF
jgi:hypothetical protein